MEAHEKLLQKLDEFGKSFLDKYESKKKVKASKPESDAKLENSVNDTNKDNGDKESNKKKKRRRRKKKPEAGKAEDVKSVLPHKKTKGKLKTKGPNRHIEQIKQELCFDEFKEKQDKEQMVLEMKKKEMSGKQPEVVVFQSRQQKQKDKDSEVEKPKPKTENVDNPVHIDLDAARSEIQKFSIKGFKGEQKDEMMKNLLIKLGAKPPKGKYHNYKEYQEMKKKEKMEAKEQLEMDRLIGNVVKKKKGIKRKRDTNDVGHVDAQVGKYTPGVLHLKKDDIFRIQNPNKTR